MFKKLFGGGKKKLSSLEKNIQRQAAENKRVVVEHVAASPPTPKPKPEPAQSATPGHDALLNHLDEKDKEDPVVRLQVAGKGVFDVACQVLSGLGGREGIRVEDLLALLGSTGGFSVILTVLAHLKEAGDSLETAGIQHIGTKDGKHYYFGEFPNHILLNSEMSVLGLSLGMAQKLGGEVGFDEVSEASTHVINTIGTPEFGVPRLPEAHRPVIAPAEFVSQLWPRINAELDRYQVHFLHKPTVIGFAIQNAMQAGKETLPPDLAAKIIIECAVPMSRLDPAEMDHPNP